MRFLFWKTFYILVNPFRRLYWRIVQPKTRGAKCLIEHEGKFLLVRLTYGHKQWTLPGGRVGIKESFEQGALRELYEETGVIPDSLRFIGEYHTRLEYKHDTVQCFYGTTTNASLKSDPVEIAEAAWFLPAALPALRRPTVDTIIKYLNKK